MKRINQIGMIAFLGIFLSSCAESPKQTKEKNHDEMHAKGEHHDHDEMSMPVSSNQMQIEMEKGGIKVYSANIAKEFPSAVLKMKELQEGGKMEAGKQQIEFKVENYELATQTDGAEERHCANSEKGQHIHFIVNNGPYQAEYEPSFEAEFMEGNNVVLAFLSRSYHESIKNGTAYVLKSFLIGENKEDTFDHNGQHLFYSRPKGTYKAEDAKRILLDFYLINTVLAEDGNKVRVSIDAVDFELPSWQPYFVEGLATGEHTVRIQLINKDGQLIEGPFNDSGIRKITVE